MTEALPLRTSNRPTTVSHTAGVNSDAERGGYAHVQKRRRVLATVTGRTIIIQVFNQLLVAFCTPKDPVRIRSFGLLFSCVGGEEARRTSHVLFVAEFVAVNWWGIVGRLWRRGYHKILCCVMVFLAFLHSSDYASA